MLIQSTLRDMKIFLIILFITLVMFGMPMALLNLNRDDQSLIVENEFEFWGVNMILNQYKIVLSAYNYENFKNKPQAEMCYIFFIMSTFITQVTMLNMLIAIMEDTFERVIENKEVNATKTKLSLLRNMATLLP